MERFRLDRRDRSPRYSRSRSLHRRRADFRRAERSRRRRYCGRHCRGLIGLGIPEIEAKRYEGKVNAGNLLISVHTESSEEISKAKDIFTKAGAEDICTTDEASTEKDHKALERPAHEAEPALAAVRQH